jgi:hypothetical protein
MIAEEHWPEFWRIYSEAMGYEAIAFSPGYRTPFLVGVSAVKASNKLFGDAHFQSSHEYVLVLNGAAARTLEENEESSINKIESILLDPIGALHDYLRQAVASDERKRPSDNQCILRSLLE